MSKKTSKSDPFAAREAAKYDRPIPSREFILEHLKQRKKPATYQELLQEFKLSSDEEQLALRRRIKAMLRDEQLERMRGGYFWLTGHRMLIKGKIQIEKGKAQKSTDQTRKRKNQVWVIPEDGSERILLNHPEGHAAYQGSQVVVSVVNAKIKHEEREGNLVEILEQQRIIVTGRFVRENNISYVIPHGKEFNQDILIPEGRENGAKDADIVVVELTLQSVRFTEPLGQIVDILGNENTPGIEIKASTRAYGLPEEWSPEVEQEIHLLTEEVPAKAKKDRLDLRSLPLVTIDGEDAKDFDDAVYCEAKSSGGWKLYVAIADVSYYVKPNTALDNEAKLRGNSVYFPGKVIPMLPEILSNGLCSLKPLVDRLCLVCVMNINQSGKITRYEFHEGLMNSAARLTYTKVAAILEGKSEHLIQQYQDIVPHLKELERLYHVLKHARESRGAIEFETLETRIIFDNQGKISRIEPVTRNDAHRIIEECMLCANVATAKFLQKHKIPGLYRVHEGPPPDKLEDLRIFLQELGLSLGGGTEPEPLDYAKLLRSIQNRKDANVIQSIMLRSLSQAVYSPNNVGHFGLAYSEYCHFTSPIRRYPDLLVHRQIRQLLQGKWTEKEVEHSKSEEVKKALLALGDHSSMTERRADEATRDAVRWLKCEYIEKHVGDVFQGIISGVTRFGFFVELKEIYIDGLVHITSLKNDYYHFDPVHHRLIGEASGIVYKLGDTVSVLVSRVSVHERKIDFELAGLPKTSGKTGKKDNRDKRHKRQRGGHGGKRGKRTRGAQTESRPQTPHTHTQAEAQGKSQGQAKPHMQAKPQIQIEGKKPQGKSRNKNRKRHDNESKHPRGSGSGSGSRRKSREHHKK